MRKTLCSFCVLSFVGFLSLSDHKPKDICIGHLESPLYDPLARQARLQGDVSIQIRVAPDGRVASVQTIAGPSLLAREAERNIRTWVFNPGDERTLAITYEFRLEQPEIYYDPPSRVTFDLPDKVRIVSNFKQINP